MRSPLIVATLGLLLLAGGTGLAPFTAMLEKIAEQGSPHPVHLIYGVSNVFDLVEMARHIRP